MTEYSWETASIATSSSTNDCPTPKDDYASRLTRLEEEVKSMLHDSEKSYLAESLEGDHGLPRRAEKVQLTENAWVPWVPPHLRAARHPPQPFADFKTGASEFDLTNSHTTTAIPGGYVEQKAGDGHSPTTSFSGKSDISSGKEDVESIKDKHETSLIILDPAIPAVEHQPIAGKSFIIRSRQEPRRILTLTNGTLEFSSKPFPSGGIFWQCVTKDGWYGFQNTVSGTYLGHNSQGKICASQPHHKAHEYFTAVRHEDGGYILLMRHGNELLQTTISEDGESLIMQKEAGTAWDFIDAQHVLCSISLAYPNMSVEKIC